MSKRSVGRPPLPNPRSRRLTVALTVDEHESLKAAAERLGDKPSRMAGEWIATQLRLMTRSA